MKTVFEKVTGEELKKRINSLNENSKAQWGKMNVSQMMKHCSQWDDMALGKIKYKQSFIGKLFGKMALKGMMENESIKKNLPTVPSFKIKEDQNFSSEKIKWITLIEEYNNFTSDGFIHPFFGFVTNEMAGYLAYKHANHHLMQFGV